MKSKAAKQNRQVMKDWIESVDEFYSCYQQLTRCQATATNCPSSQLTQLTQTMRQELKRLNDEADQLQSLNHLSHHTRTLQELIQQARACLLLAYATTS